MSYAIEKLIIVKLGCLKCQKELTHYIPKKPDEIIIGGAKKKKRKKKKIERRILSLQNSVENERFNLSIIEEKINHKKKE